MSDLTIAIAHLFAAAGYIPSDNPKKELDLICQELLDFVNSKEYQLLIINDKNKSTKQ